MFVEMFEMEIVEKKGTSCRRLLPNEDLGRQLDATYFVNLGVMAYKPDAFDDRMCCVTILNLC